MKKKLDTRFPAARIKKIMQADEDVGKIAMAVPVLVSKALELFLQDLCDRTYDITLRRGAKTVNSLHLKHCVQSYNVYDFLREVVSKVPDYGHSEAGGDERTMAKRKKASADEMNESDDELKKNRMNEGGHTSSSGSGNGEAEVGVEEEAVAEVEYLQNEILPPPNLNLFITAASPQPTSTQSPSRVKLQSTLFQAETSISMLALMRI